MDYIGIDVGTSSCKACIIREDGGIVTCAHRDYPLLYPRPGWVELDPLTMLQAVFDVLKKLSTKAGQVRGLSVCSLGESFVMLDKDDKVLMNTIVYLDNRCRDNLSYISSKMDLKELYLLTGLPLNEMYSLPKLLWIRENMPEVFFEATKIMTISGYISYMLCGEQAADCTLASRTMLMDVHKLKWSSLLMERFGMPEEKFSPIYPPGQYLGALRPNVADMLGLSKDIKVIVGCHDQCAATLGAGVIQAKDIMSGQGTTENHNVLVDETIFKNISALIDNQLCFEPYVIEGLYSVMLGQLTYGASIKWYIDTFESDLNNEYNKSGKTAYDILDERCGDENGDVFFLPYLSKVRIMDVKASALGAFMGLHMGVRKDELYRAVLEGLCFESRKNLERLGDIGVQPNQLTVTGGCTRSSLLMQIKSDVLSMPIHLLKNYESGILGLAMICAVAFKDYSNYSEAAKKFVRYSKVVHPQRDYDEKYRKYKIISNTVTEMYRYL